MGTQLIVRGKAENAHTVPRDSDLAKSELELAEAMVDHFEAFYRQGVTLKRILAEKQYTQADPPYASFDDYMDQRQPCGVKKSQAWNLMATVDIRPLLPNLDSNRLELDVPIPWTERAIAPLTNKKFAKSDIKRLGKMIASEVKKAGKLTSTMVKQICDEDLGVERKKRIKKEKDFRNASLSKNLERALEIVIQLRSDLELYYEDAWSEVEETRPHLIKSLITELGVFTSFLKG